MKPTRVISLAFIICTLGLAVRAELGGVFKFVNAEPAALLEAYRAATGLELCRGLECERGSRQDYACVKGNDFP